VGSVGALCEELLASEEVPGLTVWVRGKDLEGLTQTLLDACESEAQRAGEPTL
jgi:hypothetical protein